MRQLIVSIIFSVVALFATAENINFMTYNLLNNKGLNFQFLRIERHAQVIKESGADVVAIQELGGSSNFKTLKEKSGLTGSFFDIAGNNYGNGLLWKASLGTPTISNVRVSPSVGSTDTSTRSYTIAEFADFFFISAHYSLNSVDRDTMTARIIRFANTAGKTVFVGADFNAEPTFRSMLTFQSNNFIILNNLSDRTFTTSDNRDVLIDMILGFRKNETDKQYTVVSRGIPTPPAGINYTDISDHLPYNVTVNIATSQQADLVVTSNSDDVTLPGSLSWCINQAVEGGTIHFNVDATELKLSTAISKSLIIDGLNQFNNQRMILKKPQPNKFVDLVGATVTVKNLILDGENTPSAIGITADKTSVLTIDNCVLRNINSNGAANNGGACRIQGVATITNSLFENNTQGTGTYGGGAICLYNTASLILENTTFIGNSAVEGGAIMANGTVAPGYTIMATNCTFANNTAGRIGIADQRGGAVYLKGPTATTSNVTFINCTFTGNSAGTAGGAICAFASAGKIININLINSIFTHNMYKGDTYYDILTYNANDRIIFPIAKNCIYGVASAIAWENSIVADIPSTNLFLEKEDWNTSYARPVISEVNEQKVALLSIESIAQNAGIANVEGQTIPTKDQLGVARPTTPAIGAVEYRTTSGINQTTINTIQLNVKSRQLSFTGLTTATEMSVFSLTGNLLDKRMVNNHTAIALDKVNAAIVIVKVANQSFKVLF